jgi:UTP-glucose-1-phosphate uridylyltransferase
MPEQRRRCGESTPKTPVAKASSATTASNGLGIRRFVHTPKVFAYLKKHGRQPDAEIATGTGIAIYEVHAALSELSAQGEILKCGMTRPNNSNSVDKFQFGLAG